MIFEELNLHPDVLKAVKRQGFTEPTPIQGRCIPVLKEGKDVVAQSLTGSGKTAAFGLPMIEKVQPGKGIQALVLVPTRELACQVCEALSSFAFFTRASVTSVYGGVGMQPQIDALRKADIVVATPGRLLDHIRHNTINLKSVSFLVLDEADKMFEMGFIDDVNDIISNIPKQRQTMLFSATIPSEIHRLVSRHMLNPVVVKEQIHVDKSLLKQVYYVVQKNDKFSLLVHFLKKKTTGLAIVFCGTRHEVDALTRNLRLQKINAMAVHGGLSQNKRSHAVDSLKSENINVLVATDVAARGLDIQNISHVYNFDSPKNSSEYTHRIGRTARAGKYGEAVTLLAERDYDNFRNVQSDRSIQIVREELPEFERLPYLRQQSRGFVHHGTHGKQSFHSQGRRQGFHRQRSGFRR